MWATRSHPSTRKSRSLADATSADLPHQAGGWGHQRPWFGRARYVAVGWRPEPSDLLGFGGRSPSGTEAQKKGSGACFRRPVAAVLSTE